MGREGRGKSERRTGFRFGFRRRDDEVETAWRFQLPRPDFVAGSYEGRTFLEPANHLGEDSAHLHHDAIHAIADGVVRYSGRATGYGRVVLVEHLLPDGNRVCSIYGHLCGHSGYPLIANGSAVEAGDVVGYIGDVQENGDGREHLHLGIRKGAYDGNFCGYARAPECTPRHYESPTLFIERRSGRMRLVAGPFRTEPPEGVEAETAFDLTVRNDYHYGGAFEFRLALRAPGGDLRHTGPLAQRLAPGVSAPLQFRLTLPAPGRYEAAVEMRTPRGAAWIVVAP